MGRILTRPRTPVAARLLRRGEKAAGKLVLNRKDPINRGVLHVWDFRDEYVALSDLADSRTALIAHANSSWQDTPKGRGLNVTSSQDGTGGPTVSIGTNEDFSIVFNMWLESAASNDYIGEFGAYDPGFNLRGTPLVPSVFWAGAHRPFASIPFDTLPAYQCIVYVRENGILYGYNNGVKSPTTFSISDAINTAFTYNGGFGTARATRTDLSLRIYSRALDDNEARRLSDDLNAGLVAANDAPFRFSVAGGVVSVGLASETDTALSVTPSKVIAQAVGQASETDSALGVTPVKAITAAIVQASETDSALGVTPVKVIQQAVGQPTETNAALSVTPVTAGIVAVGLSTETDSALSISPIKDILAALGQANETDTALSISPPGVSQIPVGISAETDSALSVSPVKNILASVGQPIETDSAPSIQPAKHVAVGLAVETDSALAVSPIHDLIVALGIATETDRALSISFTLPNIDEILQGCPSVELQSGIRTTEWECN